MSIVQCEHCGKKNRVPAAVRGTPRCARCHRPLPWITDAGDDDFSEIADQSTIPVLVDLWAPWCGPCRMVSPALERLAHEMAGRVKLVKVDVDTAPRTGQRLAVRGIPTLLLLDRGRVIARQTGAAPEPALRTWIEQGLRNRDADAGVGTPGPV